MELESNFSEFLHKVRIEGANRLLAAGFHLQTELKIRLSTAGPTPSVPGEYPHAQTFHGRDSVMVVPDTPEGVIENGMTVYVGFLEPAWYMVYLEEEKERLGLFYLYQEIKPELQQLLGAGGSSRIVGA